MSLFGDRDQMLLFQHVCQIFLCLYGARYSYVAISNLKTYEETSKKLAEWSSEAARQLHKTRTTQSIGVVTIFISFLVATTLLVGHSFIPEWLRFVAPPITLLIVLGGRYYIKDYWSPPDKDGNNKKTDDGKDKVAKMPLMPNMEAYNEAATKTEDLLKMLEYLEYSWAATSFFAGLNGWTKQ